jgi:hypothetical protein
MRIRTAVYTSFTIGMAVMVAWLWWRDILTYILAFVLFVIIVVPLTCALTFSIAFLYHLGRTWNPRDATIAAAGATKAACNLVLNSI